MAIPYTDIDTPRNRAQDFVIRQRIPSATQVILLATAALLTAFLLVVYVDDRQWLGLLLAAIIGAGGWLVVAQMHRDRDLLLATEFQNALFSSALGINNKFCIIVRSDGNVVYLDRMFQDMFPDFLRLSQRNLDTLMVLGNVSREDSEKIFRAVDKGVYEKVIFKICDVHGHETKIVMSVEPLLRPSGFILLRGREFVERVTVDTKKPLTSNVLSDNGTMALFSYIMDTMNMGVYMTSPRGEIIYINPVLERWLGYADNEALSGNLALQDVIYQEGKRPDSVEPDDFMGEIVLKKKAAGLIKAFLNQKIIRDGAHNVVGCTALVHYLGEQAEPKKKKNPEIL